ncbi:SDR family oxidoreductase [Paenarthrobacter sp. PH39-S1]|uniref:SDR family NAD(P)-dependent oxidoreductase n=1 Tax=Paenarthrobacter sp. PH39-S1 TaxID=3046204 RepID=UPI0024BA3324|nr:SDR family oxidoreductase [Paenarthrobacter sp. PH39-S1]MDJ0356697.1 SDR family oxidoreductase [Paenarthrobacter sp. PH39-S1]
MTGAERLDGKVALVTGASQGIGAAIAAALAAAGAHVVLASRNEAALLRQVKAITDDGGLAVAVPADVTNERSVRGLLAGIRSRFGRLDVAVNNAAGGGRPPAPMAEWTSEQFDSAIAVNLRGTFLCLKYELELMREAENGAAIVNMSSTAGEQGVAGLSGYAASKFGIGGLTRVAALDYAASGVRVNAIAPGPVFTNRLTAAGAAAQAGASAAVPLGRIGRVEEIAAATLWLCSDASSFVTGTVLAVDGGRLAGTPAFTLKP